MRLKAMLAVAVGAVLIVGTTLTSAAHARGSVPIVDHENLAIATGSGRQPSPDDVKHAIIAAAATTKYRWTIADGQPGSLVATTLVRGKHTVAVSIVYTATQYSVTYRDSNNMNYALDDGVPEIHPNYNVWVRDFIAAINLQLLKL